MEIFLPEMKTSLLCSYVKGSYIDTYDPFSKSIPGDQTNIMFILSSFLQKL